MQRILKRVKRRIIPTAWHPNRWWDWCMPKDEKKERNPMFIEEL